MERDYLKEGLSLINKANYEEAEKILIKATNTFPENEKLLNLLGWVFYQREKYKELIDVYKKLVKLNPQQSFSMFYNLGRAYYMINDYRSAIEAFTKTLELAPNHKNALFYISASYEKLGDIKTSKKFLTKLINQGKLDEEIKDISIQEGLKEYTLQDFVEFIKTNKVPENVFFSKASLFGTWSINNEFLCKWSGRSEFENFIEHIVFKDEGSVVLKGNSILVLLSADDVIMVAGSRLIGVDNYFECGFNKSNIIKIKGPRKVIIQLTPCFVEDIKEADVIKKENVMALIGNLKIKANNEKFLSIQKGTGIAILA